MKFKLNKHGVKNYTKVLEKRLMHVEKKGIEYLWNELYTKTPMDTGAARSSWNISVNAPNYSFDKNKKSNSLQVPSFKVNDSLIIASGCPYIKVLNDGWSKQAPKNFIQISVINTKKYMNSLRIKELN
jgi:hypothetical protein